MQAGLADNSDPDASKSQVRPTTVSSGFVPPDPADLAKLFPQLEMLELVGQGGMGAVYKARQPGLDRLVAIKILPPEIGPDASFAERFTREARALARLSHNHIVSVYDFGEADGLFFILMEYVDGVNLRQTIQSGGLSPQQALAIVPQICEALQFAHDEGIVHRDIKPENILIDKRGRVKIADFGIAKLLGTGATDDSLTATHQVMGTLRYMAPEQMQGSREVDHRADIYSLGVVFYELLTGELPMGKFAPPSKKVQIDVRLDEVVLRALEQDPEQRYQHASDVKNDVDNITRHGLRAPHARSGDLPRTAQSARSPVVPRGASTDASAPRNALMLSGIATIISADLTTLALVDPLSFDAASFQQDAVKITLVAMQGLALAVGICMVLGSLAMRKGATRLARWSMVLGYAPLTPAWLITLPLGIYFMAHTGKKTKTGAGPDSSSPSRSEQPDRPPLVLVLATIDLIASVLLMLLLCLNVRPYPESMSRFWHWCSQVEIVWGLIAGAGLCVASIALFLWKPWARRLMLGVCFFFLALWVIALPDLTQVALPMAWEETRQDLIHRGHPAEQAESHASLGLTIGFGGVLVVGLTWLIGHLVYFTRPRVVAAFDRDE